jgi:very-short-patch-repair endonuclease
MAMRLGQLYKGTPAEHALEDAVAALGIPYRVQFPGYLYGLRFFPDVFLPTLRLVIEVDDPSHNRAEKIEKDAERTATLQREWGVRVVRCTNENARNDPSGTVRAMLKSVGLWPITDAVRTRRLADYMPKTKKAPQKERRAAKSAALQKRRGQPAPPQRGNPRSPRTPQSRPAPVEAPTPTPALLDDDLWST